MNGNRPWSECAKAAHAEVIVMGTDDNDLVCGFITTIQNANNVLQ